VPSLTVVVPSRDRLDLLRRCLASLRRHAPAGTEAIVVDDGSPGAAVSRVAADLATRSIRLPVSRGFAAAANAGAAAAASPFIELLNDDAEVTSGWADAALARLAEARVVAVAPLVLLGPPETASSPPLVDSAGDGWFVGGVAWKRGHRRPLTPALRRARRVAGASASSAFYRRDAFLAAGGLAEDFGAYFEDVDLSLRLRRAGGAIWYEPASVVWHRVSASYGRPAGALLEMQSRNEERLFWRQGPAWLAALPLHAAVVLAKAWRRWREGALRPWLRGRLRAWREACGLLGP
jgi:GT2 family glycosyltransferase